MIKIVVAGIDGCLGSAFIGLTDTLTLARDAIMRTTGVEAPFQMVTASADGAGIIDGFGHRFDVAASFEEISSCDAILTPSFQPDETGQAPSMSNLSGVAAWIRRQHSRGALVCGAGTGVFLLGEAGLLDGRRCTTAGEERYHANIIGRRLPESPQFVETKNPWPKTQAMGEYA